MIYSFAISGEVVMKLGQEEQCKAERQEKTNDQCCKGHRFIFRNLFLEIYSYTTVMVMCPKQQQNANWIQVEIEKLIVRGRNLPKTNSTKSETQNIFAKKQQNEHTPGFPIRGGVDPPGGTNTWFWQNLKKNYIWNWEHFGPTRGAP